MIYSLIYNLIKQYSLEIIINKKEFLQLKKIDELLIYSI